MSVLVLVEFPLKPEAVDQLVGIMQSPDGLAKTRAHDGCEGVTGAVHRDTNTLVLAETWSSREKHEAYMAWRTETGMVEAVSGMLTGALSVRYCEVF